MLSALEIRRATAPAVVLGLGTGFMLLASVVFHRTVLIALYKLRSAGFGRVQARSVWRRRFRSLRYQTVRTAPCAPWADRFQIANQTDPGSPARHFSVLASIRDLRTLDRSHAGSDRDCVHAPVAVRKDSKKAL
jgi:hypothetical protein